MRLPNYHPTEERLNYLTHGISAGLSIIGIIILIRKGLIHRDSYLLIGMVIFGLCMFFTFLTSTLYHWAQHRQLKKRLRLLDHLAIYLLIAGTYTPFALNNLRTDWGFLILALIWAIAAMGITYKIAFRHHFDKLGAIDTFMYIGMGFLAIPFLKPMLRSIQAGGLALLIAGGVAYMAGVFFYESKTIRYNHAIWHVFVMTGAFLHYLSVLFYVLPPAG